MKSAPLGAAGDDRLTSDGTRAASTPNGLAPPPIRMPDPFISNAGLTRTASRGWIFTSRPILRARSTSPSDSQLSVIPASIASRNSLSRLPGPAKLILAGLAPAARAISTSPPEATSMPSTRPIVSLRTGA